MPELEFTSDELISSLLSLSETKRVCILDSCGVGHLGSHLLIAGIEPVSVTEIFEQDVESTLRTLDDALTHGQNAAFFTLSYEFGKKILNIDDSAFSNRGGHEPDAFIALFDVLIVHDYDNQRTSLVGNAAKFKDVRTTLERARGLATVGSVVPVAVRSNFTKQGYLSAISSIKERIRSGDTYQTNLTQKLSCKLPVEISPESIFIRLRRNHPAPFAAFIRRPGSTVISASPERFFRVNERQSTITTSPIKGTRPRADTPAGDDAMRSELLSSPKDRAENTMIVDLLRNDLGRVCEYGSVRVEKLCDLEEHPTLFHLVSTVSGELARGSRPSDLIRAVFPCGSITGAPKISTMHIIDEIEPSGRGLSMGAIGYRIPDGVFDLPGTLDLNVAIRTMVVRDGVATFNVGGGIVIDSDPEKEYDESLTKAKALLDALGAQIVN